MPASPDLEFLFYFSCDPICVLEAKIKGLSEETPPHKVYHWLGYDRVSQQFLKLCFKSMGSNNGQDFRIFEQGELRFDSSKASLRLEVNGISKEYNLTVNDVDFLPIGLVSQVQHFLLNETGES